MLFLKLQLKTDFHDYYDHWFDWEGQIFERMSHSGMSRREMFDFFEQIGLKTPPYGTPKGILESLSDFEKKMENLVQGDNFNLIDVVVYLGQPPTT